MAVVGDSRQQDQDHVIHQAGGNGQGRQEKGIQGHLRADVGRESQIHHPEDHRRLVAPKTVGNALAAVPQQSRQGRQEGIPQQGIDEPFQVIPVRKRRNTFKKGRGTVMFGPDEADRQKQDDSRAAGK